MTETRAASVRSVEGKLHAPWSAGINPDPAYRPMIFDEHLLNDLARQEDLLVFDTFDNRTAIQLGLQMMASAERQAKTLTIDISRCNQQLFHIALPGTVQDFDHWIMRKQALVYRMGHSSFYTGVELRLLGRDLLSEYQIDPRHFSASGGGFPIRVRHVGLVGVVAVSGLPEDVDHAFVVTELAAFLDIDLAT